MSVCTFFGSRDSTSEIKPRLREVLVELIENQGVDVFYVGNKGCFDALVRSCLRELSQQYPHIHYAVVLERMHVKPEEFEDYSDTMLPEGIENALPRFAIAWRNRRMLRQADIVVTHVTRFRGGAAQFSQMAERQKKTVISI